MRITIRSLKMTQINIDFGGEHEAALRIRALSGWLPGAQFTVRAASFVAILFLIGFLFVDIGTILMIISKVLAAGLSLLLLIAAVVWGVKWFGRQMDVLVEWWIRLWERENSRRKFALAQTQRSQQYQRHRFLV